MSLQDKKAGLFGKSSGSSGPEPQGQILPKKTVSHVTTTAAIQAGSHILSKEAKQKKIDEAKFYRNKGLDLIKTSVFKWTADHLAAAPAFEKAALCYVALGELDDAKKMYFKAAESQEKYDAHASAAVSLNKAAQIAMNQSLVEECADIHARASDCWLLNGEADKAGDSLIRAAKAVEESNSSRAWTLYQRAIELMYPASTPRERIVAVPALTGDALRDILRFLLRARMVREALALTPRMILLYAEQGYEQLMCKAMLTLTLLQLEAGDVVLADQTFMQEHLSVSMYLKSPECKCAEDFISAFKSLDPSQLEAAQLAREVSYLDSEVQQLARGLSLMASKKRDTRPLPTQAPLAPPAAPTSTPVAPPAPPTSWVPPTTPTPKPAVRAPVPDDLTPTRMVSHEIPTPDWTDHVEGDALGDEVDLLSGLEVSSIGPDGDGDGDSLDLTATERMTATERQALAAGQDDDEDEIDLT